MFRKQNKIDCISDSFNYTFNSLTTILGIIILNYISLCHSDKTNVIIIHFGSLCGIMFINFEYYKNFNVTNFIKDSITIKNANDIIK